jgi:hypothetical protein
LPAAAGSRVTIRDWEEDIVPEEAGANTQATLFANDLEH